MIRVDYTRLRRTRNPIVLLQAYDIIEVPEGRYVFGGGESAQTLLGTLTGGLSSAMQSTGNLIPPRILILTSTASVSKQSSMADFRREGAQKDDYLPWIDGLAILTIFLIYKELTAVLYILATRGVTAILARRCFC